jgi:general secretion pathway protein L
MILSPEYVHTAWNEMPEKLIIRFSAANDQVDWVILDANGVANAPLHGTLADAAAYADERTVIALAPASSVLRLQAKIPLKGAVKIRQALPFALEEQLAGDIEAQHFAFSKANSSGQIPVAIVDNELIAGWLTQLESVGLKAAGLYAESDGVPALPATISVLIDGNSTIIRDHLGEFTVTDTETLQMVLEMLLDQHSESMENDASTVPVNLLIYCSDADHETLQELWEQLRLRTENIEIKILGDGALPFIATQINSANSINLLQGSYAPKSDIDIEWEPWQFPATLLGGLLLLILLFKGVLFWQLSREEAALDTAASEVLQQTFPDAGDAQDPWGVLQSRLGAASSNLPVSGPGFAEAMETLASAFSQTPNIKLQTMSWRSGILDLQLLAPNVDTLDKLRQDIGKSNEFIASIQSANPDKDVIKGRIQITAVTP